MSGKGCVGPKPNATPTVLRGMSCGCYNDWEWETALDGDREESPQIGLKIMPRFLIKY